MRVCLHMYAWQMYFRLSAWPSLSISPSRVLTAVQRSISMCQQTANPVQVLSNNPSWCSFLWILLICLSLYPSPTYFSSLALSVFNQSSSSASFTSRTKAPSSLYLSPFVIIPAHSTSHHHTLQCITQSSPFLQPQKYELHYLHIM